MASTSTTVGSPARDGVLAMLPMLAGYMPFALVIGSAAADRGTPLAGWAGSWLILGGSAHLATMRTLDEAGVLAAIFTGLLINARLLVYSASLAGRWGGQPRWFRFAAAGLIIDPTWAVAERHAALDPGLREHRRYFLAAGLTLAAGWSGAMAVGAVLGARHRRRRRRRPAHRQLAGGHGPAGRRRRWVRDRAGGRPQEAVVTWVAIVAVGLGSFAFRLGPLLLFQRISLSERGERLLRQAGISAIVALIVVSTRNEATGSVAVPTVLAVAVGTVLAARGASMVRLLVGGGSVYAASVLIADLLTR